MKTLSQQLIQYARYHRDRRNIATHFVGIPMIVLAAATLLSRPYGVVAGVSCSAAVFLAAALSVFYLSLNLSLGLLMAVLMGLSVLFGGWVAAQETGLWLAVGLGGFGIGWVFQLVGHVFEGRKPAFVDDVVGLAIGPLFVVAETLFGLGLFKPLQAEIELHAGKVR